MKPEGSSGTIARAAGPSSREWLRRMARVGYASRGVVYLIIGALAMMQAIGSVHGKATGTQGALSTLSESAPGTIALIVIGIGFLCFAAWRCLQVIFDLDHKGSDTKGWIKRLPHTVSAIVYATLGVRVATVLFTGRGGSGNDEGSHQWTAWLVEKPGGVWAVGLIGAIIVSVGVAYVIKGFDAGFEKQLSAAYERWPWARAVCRFGWVARGVVFGLIGTLFIVAAVKHQPGKAGGVGTTLRELQQQPWGWILMGIAALGLFAFGIYGLIQAWYRKINLE